MKNCIGRIMLALVGFGDFGAARSLQDCTAVMAAFEQQLESQRHLLGDWAGLIRYGSENT
jgi:hypothetical protein